MLNLDEAIALRRKWVVEALMNNPTLEIVDPDVLARLDDASADCEFEELGLDSLARMEMSIWLQTEYGVEVDEEAMLANPSVNALARHLAQEAR